MFMHIGGMGSQEKVGAGVRSVLEAVGRMRSARSVSPPAVLQSSLDVPALEKILKVRGRLADGVYKAVIPRTDVKLKDEGAEVDACMGFNTWMAFQGSPEKAAVSGDFAMLEGEVAGVLRALVEGDIEVTAIHNHMITEKPRVVFLHFWGVGPEAGLAQTLRAALDTLGGRR
jgi:hypothetical protein